MSGTLYDFSNANSGQPQAHPDFNSFGCGLSPGMVEDTIGTDRKPVPNSPPSCWTSSDSFNQWFNNCPGVNYMFPYTITAYWNADNNAYEYSNQMFFPLDGQGYGNDNNGHNFGFCLEIHSQFTYMGGETFEFQGDDDVWVFINDDLVVDLGGTHTAEWATVYLDQQGLTIGQTYTFDFFFCERHVTESHMSFSTSLQLDPCGSVDSDDDGIMDKCDNCPFGDIDLKLDIGSVTGKTVSVDIALGTSIRNPVDVEMDWGDGETSTTSISVDSSVSHTYAKQGSYTVSASVSAAGCGSDTDTCDNKIGDRIAPSCTKTVTIPS